MSQKNAYSQAVDEIRDKIAKAAQAKGRSSSAVSKSDLDNMAVTLLNTPDHSVPVYTYAAKDTSGTGEPLCLEKRPSKRYRDSLKPTLRALGLDKNDVDQIDDIPLPKEHAAALMDVATTVIKDYITAGRKFTFPITAPDETRMEIYTKRAPERVSMGNRFSKDPNADETMTVTHERTIVTAKNPVPYWLKEIKR